MRARLDRRRGAAFLVVLWFAVAAAGLALALLETSRGSVPDARRAVDAARLRAAVQAAVHLTAERLLLERLELGGEGALLAATLDEIELRVRVTGESGLVDLAAASPDLLRRLARASGLSAERAAALADGIERLRNRSGEEERAAAVAAGRAPGETLRPPARPGLDHPIETLALVSGGGLEAGEVEAPARWLSATTLGTARAEPLPELAPRVVRAALAGDRAASGSEPARGPRSAPEPQGPRSAPEQSRARRSDPAGLYRLEIVASTPGGRVAVRSVRLALRSGEARPVRIVDWSAPLMLTDGPPLQEGS